MTVAALYDLRHHYPVAERSNLRQFLSVFRDSLPSLLLIFIIIRRIIGGGFTPTMPPASRVNHWPTLCALDQKINSMQLRVISCVSV